MSDVGGVDPEQEALLADSIGPVLLVILHTLPPAERFAFVLHDVFSVPFGDIASVVGRSPAAARQLASRGRRRVRGAAPVLGAELTLQRSIVEDFLAAARDGDFEALLKALDPESWCVPMAPRRCAVRRRWPGAPPASRDSLRSPCLR